MNPRNVKRWLAASLVLNLFLAGGIAGGAWRWWQANQAAAAFAGTPANAAAPARGLRFAADDLQAEQRRAYRIGLRDARREAAASIEAAREGRQEVMRLLNAPLFDRAALVAALARTREADTASRTRLESSVVEFASALSPQDRQKFAGGLAKRSSLGTPGATAAPPAASSPLRP